MTDTKAQAIPVISELRISAVKNGLIVTPREPMYRDGYAQDCYVFQTVEQLASWMLKQAWAIPGVIVAKGDRELALAWAREVQSAKTGNQDMPGMAFFVWEGDYGRYEIPQDLAAELLLRRDGWPDKRSPGRLKRLMDWVAEQEAAAALSSKTDTSGASHG